jgi:hypothetical protein
VIALTASPSGGEFEILNALLAAHAITGNDKSPARIKRHLPKRTGVAEVTTVLQAQSGTYVHSSGGNYSLTTAGLARARTNFPRRSPIYIT